MYEYLDGVEVAVGDYVHVAEDRPEGFSAADTFKVVAVNSEEDSPGKLIGLEAPTGSPFLHDADGATDANRGWWTRPENIARAAD